MIDTRIKFNNFVENMRTDDNSELIDTIHEGFQYISESLSTDDANVRKLCQAIPISGVPANATNIQQNADNEYFNQTLTDKQLSQVNNGHAGKRVWEHAKAGKWVVSNDPLKFGTPGNQNTVGGNDDGWAGSSGGYSLGGPTQGSSLA